MRGEQLDLWSQLRIARQDPASIDIGSILDAVEATAAQLPDSERLWFAGEALLQVAELCADRADGWMTEWEESYRDPIVGHGFFADVVRQTMAVDLSELMEPIPPRKPRVKSTSKPEGSIAAPADKEAILAMVAQMEATAEMMRTLEVLAIAPDENVAQWREAIAQWLLNEPERSVLFTQLCCGLKIPWVEVWMGALLGGFELEQQGEFYQSAIWVKCSRDIAILNQL